VIPPIAQTQVKFVWGICTNRDQTHDSSEVDECLNDLEASGNDRSDGEFGFKLKRNGKNEDEIRTQVTDMCSDVYADVVRQGIVVEDDATDDGEGGKSSGYCLQMSGYHFPSSFYSKWHMHSLCLSLKYICRDRR
jgi:hypothetical protein